ncbi:hypothetical protein CMV_013603 [Castanea mollissima]|uniref:Uncharacterized protein n=1 Tax=Castanea mollissima TaxID=60419 RepID=A0A8J4RDJ1_9ROSI|nr:hypothetical protein CMV_013603 [Castanea mollissima]
MATTKLNVVCAFLLVLVLHHGILDVEGRHLKSDQAVCNKCSMHVNTLTAAKVGDLTNQSEQTSKMEHVDDFRPTEPGHSPGVGHSINS